MSAHCKLTRLHHTCWGLLYTILECLIYLFVFALYPILPSYARVPLMPSLAPVSIKVKEALIPSCATPLPFTFNILVNEDTIAALAPSCSRVLQLCLLSQWRAR